MNNDIVKSINELLVKFPDNESALLPVLLLLQNANGYVSGKDMEILSGMLNISQSRIYSTASFYSMLNLKPLGKYNIQVCTNVVCTLLTPNPLLEYITKCIGIKIGETTSDGLFSLVGVECIGACGNAPAMMINLDRYENVTFDDVDEIIGLIREEGSGK